MKMTADQAQKEIVEALLNVAKSATPQEFQAFLGGVVGNVVGNMSERYWLEFQEIKPCGIVGCDCHLTIIPTTMKLLETIRLDHQDHQINTFNE